MAGNVVTLEFAGDAKKLAGASQDAKRAVTSVGDATTAASSEMADASREAQAYTDRVGQLGAGVTGMTDAIDSAGAAVQGLADIQSASRDRAMKLARAQADVEQAMLDGAQAAVDLEQAQVDLNQAQADGRQSGIDLKQATVDQKQAHLDAATALKDYNAAVAEHGAGSAEAQQAAIDLEQAEVDLRQAQEDAKQAQLDWNQAQTDGKQATLDSAQAVRDGKDAQLDLNDAMKEANPSGLQKWADNIALVTPLLTALVGVVGLVTAAQWAWNAAQLASPTTWIIAGIAAIVAIIVVIATKTDWFQRAWRNSWKWIKDAAANTMEWIKGIPAATARVFSSVAQMITRPYRAAFNMIARAWNATVGRLSFTVPGWIPGIGGNSFSVPNIPQFHSGGRVPGTPGQVVPSLLMAGEKVLSPAGAAAGGAPTIVFGSDGSQAGDAIIELIRLAMLTRNNGDPGALGIKIAR